MLDLTDGFRIRQPISVWNRPLKADFRQLFRALAQTALQGYSGNWQKAAFAAADATKAVGVKGQRPPELAYLLIRRALTLALFQLTHSLSTRFDRGRKSFEPIAEALDLAFEETEVELDGNFFEHPRDLALLVAIRKPFAQFLIGVGVSAVEARTAAGRLDSYFVFALHQEWRRHAADYRAILDALEGSPFAEAKERERRWWEYAAWLDRQLDEPVFDEAFGLRQVYIPLRAFWREPLKGRSEALLTQNPKHPRDHGVQHLVDLEDELTSWVDAAHKDDAIRVLSGGPGSGKSSFSRVFGARMARRFDLRVIVVPLHHFDPQEDLIAALVDFTSRDSLLPDSLLDPESNERLLVIFDGLDELAQQGRLSHETAQNFVREVRRTLDRENQRELRLQVLLSGREVAIQTHQSGLRRGTRVLHLLGYLPVDPREFQGSEDLIQVDQRSAWWQRFGEATGRKYEDLPQELSGQQLKELTDQPLLNYLLALSYVREELDFSTDANLNQIYRDLLSAVYERGWDRQKGHPATEGMEEDQFIRILEEIAQAAWHGDGSKATVRSIQDRCRRTQLRHVLLRFEKDAEEGVTQLLTAFYFRQHGKDDEGYRTFEFTHKSFGEYLTARRIVRQVVQIDNGLTEAEKDPDRGIDEQEGLVRWARCCGPSDVDTYLNHFLRAEVALRDPQTCDRWQKMTIRLLLHLLHHGMPMTELGLSSYREMRRQARNAEEALLAVHSACAWVTQKICNIKWPSATSAGAWLHELRGQRDGSGYKTVLSSLNYLDLRRQTLDVVDLDGAVLQGASLEEASLYGASLDQANLEQARLYGARLHGAKLDRANLNGANLHGAILDGASLAHANLRGARLDETILNRANLDRADLRGASLHGASLDGVRLEDTRLKGVYVDSETSFKNTSGDPLAASEKVLRRIRAGRR